MVDELLYWGYHSDLRHGRVLRAVGEGELPRPLKLAAAQAGCRDQLVLPTQLQPWGPLRERYVALMGQDGAA